MIYPLQSSIDKNIRQLVSNASGLDFDTNVIPADDPHPSPNEPYATVKEITKIVSGIDSVKVFEGPDPLTQKTLKYSGRRIITYSVQFYKDGAADFAEGLLGYASTDAGQIWLAQNGLTWEIAGPVQNLDSIMGSKFEIRRAIDITLRYQSARKEDINAIGSVEIDLTLSAETDLTETVEVTDA
ncbi:hypothetical protein KAR91_86840 [Candidatus Pacearchaeota archaeon]|nr:hypothetical protein [Candidatus Pacearchaeota archaeon]